MSIHTRTTARGKVYDVRLRAPNGREISRTFRTKREALEYEARQITAKGRGIWTDPRGSQVMFRDLAEEWLDCNPAKRQTTRARDESALRVHVYPTLGSRKIGTLTPTDIRKLVSEWSETMAPRTVRRVYGALRACFNYAVESELLSRTPCRGIRLPAVEPTVSRIPAVPEVVALVEAMRPQFAAMVWWGVVLGLRWGEVAGLRVKRVDLLLRTVTIAEQVSRDVGGIGMIGPPKSAAGRRTISIPIELAETLSAHLVSVGLTGADADALLFSNAEGLPLDYSNWRRRVWLPAVEAAGLSGLGFHDLRVRHEALCDRVG